MKALTLLNSLQLLLKKIVNFITQNLHKGATVSEGYKGAFSNDKKSVILTALNRRQAILLKNFTKEVDPHAFILISNTSDIIGKGFRETI